MLGFLSKLISTNEAEVRRLLPLVEKVKSFEPTVKKLRDKDFPKKTAELKLRLERGQSLNDLLPEAFALVKEASARVNNETPRDVQVMAGIVLHEGKIAEQKTGEGKTLTASMPLYLNALTGRGVHLVTVNEYLAKRDCGWMGRIFDFLGLTTAVITRDSQFGFDKEVADSSAQDWRLRNLKTISKKEAYQADITYGINSEFGFDYLRDNMATRLDDLVQRGFHFAIIDEADSVLIDEARTPHILSAASAEPTKKYYEYAALVQKLTPKLDYIIDEKLRTAHLTDHGVSKVESLLGAKDIYENDFATVHHIEAALKARTLYQKEKDYIVRDNKVIIVDEFTGRLLLNNRWSEGIHQAVEAKEGVAIQQESKTLATISLQNYFRKYAKLAGMTGTAITEAEEFNKIYKLEVVSVPTHRPMVRADHADQVYKTQRAKYAAVVKDIEESFKAGRPVLVGTTSIEKNEIISQFLRHKGIPHQVLNAKQHEKEAMIISQAGKKGAVTVATNMAGRGVDIILGGNTPTHEDGRPKLGTPEWKKWQADHDEVVSVGGLHVIGTERHESRRIDNQLRGRAGRQGDPGSSRFFVALDDEIMRLFGGEQVGKLMTFFNLPEDQPLEHGIVSKSIESAQSKVEQFNFDHRKHLLEYDDVMNKQREIIYDLRRKILEAEVELEPEVKKETAKKKSSKTPNSEPSDVLWLKEEVLNKVNAEIALLVNAHAGTDLSEANLDTLMDEFTTVIPLDDSSKRGILERLRSENQSEQTTLLQKIAQDIYSEREKQLGANVARYIEQQQMLRVIDELWMEHLETVNDLREGIGLRGYAQRDPLVEYKTEAFSLFEKLIAAIDYEIVHRIFKVAVVTREQKPLPTAITNAEAIEAIEGGVTDEVKKLSSKKEPDNFVADQPASNWDVSTSSITNASQATGTISTQSKSSKVGRNDPCPCGSGLKYKKCGLINSPEHQRQLAKA